MGDGKTCRAEEGRSGGLVSYIRNKDMKEQPVSNRMVPDKGIIYAARDIMLRRYVEGKHSIGAAIRTKKGNLFAGVSVEAKNGRISICGESIAIGIAATNGDTNISQIVAVTESGDIVPPCGMCRELISDYSPDASVILETDGKIRCVPILDLLPEKYDGSKYPNRRRKSPV
ncbi:MAG: cytidine deaminase [Elusimicrobia bacterium]|nr:cytidine deaminase [Elusimicrobiota bacterium]